jgi:hypothetical protein
MKVTITIQSRTAKKVAKALGNEIDGPYVAQGCGCVQCVILRKVRSQIRRQLANG